MAKKMFVGIDPGLKGAMVTISEDKKIVSVCKFNETLYKANLDLLEHGGWEVHVCLEQVHAMPKQGVCSCFNFGLNFGIIQGLLIAYGFKYSLVSPMKWKRHFGVTSDKATSISKAHELFPEADLRRTERCKKDDDGIAEALLLAEYCRQKHTL